MKRRSRGFTLMELMVVLAVAAAILSFGVPNFRDFQRNNRITVSANDSLGLFLSARSEALRRQVTVSTCASANPTLDTATCAAGNRSWIAYIDKNNDCTRTSDEEIVANAVIASDVNSATNGACISFAATGFKRLVPGQPPIHHVMFCDSRGNTARSTGSPVSAARGVEILQTGRGAVIKTLAELTPWASGTNTVACP